MCASLSSLQFACTHIIYSTVFADLLKSTLYYIQRFFIVHFSHTTIKHLFPFASFLSLFCCSFFILHFILEPAVNSRVIHDAHINIHESIVRVRWTAKRTGWMTRREKRRMNKKNCSNASTRNNNQYSVSESIEWNWAQCIHEHTRSRRIRVVLHTKCVSTVCMCSDACVCMLSFVTRSNSGEN